MAFLFAKSFPFCIPPEKETKDIQVGSGTNYPIGMTLEHAMALYWKSRTFSSIISYSASVVVDNGGAPFSINASYSQSGQLSLGSPLWPTKMSEMICFSSAYGYPSYSGGSTGSGQITSSLESLQQRDIQSSVTFFSSSGDIIIRDDSYYPKIITLSYMVFGGNNSYSAVLTSIAGANTRTVNDALNIKINGTEYRANLFIRLSVNEFSFAPDSASASFEVNGLNDREAN
jgi:hypothetical protein